MSNINNIRIRKGLCPKCGEEAAPYYYCDRCRLRQKVSRLLNKGAKSGCLSKAQFDGDKRQNVWKLIDKSKIDEFSYNEVMPGDKRLQPRRNGIPIEDEEIENALIRAIGTSESGIKVEELNEAWGKMRLRKGRSSAADDLVRIVIAARKRKARLAKRASAANSEAT